MEIAREQSWLLALLVLVMVSAIVAKENVVDAKSKKYVSCSCFKGDRKIYLGCVGKEEGQFTIDSNCEKSSKSSINLGSCEDRERCLYSWQTKEWSNCTQACGRGTRTRSLQCQRYGPTKMAADSSRCRYLKKPPTTEYCNEVDCSAQTFFVGWSQCSRACGDGVRYKQLDCVRRLANGSIVQSPDCKKVEVIPNLTKPCHNQPCEFDNSNFIKVEVAGENRRRRRGVGNLPVIKTGSGNHWQTKPKGKVEAVIGERVSAIKGTEITLKCVYGGKPEPRATWFHNGRRIDNNRRLPFDYSYKDYMTILGIPKLEKHLIGKYECHIENKDGRLSATSIVRMIRPGEATIFSQRKNMKFGAEVKKATITIGTNVTVYDNTELKILCPVQAYPYRHRVSWNIQGAASIRGITRYGLYGTGLIIRKTRVENSGRYTCRGQTLWGSDKESSYILIKGKSPPKIKSSNRELIGRFDTAPFVNVTVGDSLFAEEGARIMIACHSSGEPKPKITWQRRGVPIQLPNLNMFVKKESSILVIKSIKGDASDAYSCVATNVAGQDTATTKITVLPQGSTAPKINEGYGTVTITGEKRSKSAVVGQKIKVFEGKSLALYCPASGRPRPNVSWRFNGKNVEELGSTNFMVDKVGGGLLIFGINKKIEGTYSCVVRNPLGESSASSSLKILASSYPSVISRSKVIKTGKEKTSVSIVIGDQLKTSGGRNIKIICAVEGWPAPKVIWNKNGNALKSKSRKINIGTARGEMLTIDSAVEADSGVYTCYAMNPAGVAMSSSDLKILTVGSPVIISEVGSKNLLQNNKDSRVTIGTNVTAALGNTLTIKCPFEGSSDSQVTWNVDKQPIGYNERIRKTGDNSLMIKNLKFFDSGVYTCKVWNSEGHDSEKTLLTISGAHNSILKVSNRKSKIESYNSDEDLHVLIGHDITLTQGHSIHITCPYRGISRPTIQWLKNNAPIKAGSRKIAEGEQLLLKEVTREDSGSYSCVATTRFGSSNSTTQLTVIVPTKPTIERNDRDIKAADTSSTMEIGVGDRLFAVEDMTIEIKCPISAGVPKPKVFWRHNNAVIISNGVYAQVKDNNDLLIPKLDASLQGLYTCVAENIEGKDEASTTIMIMLSTAPAIVKSNRQITQKASSSNLLSMSVGDTLKTSAGYDVMLNCQADGIPKPKVMWAMDGREVVESEAMKLYQNGSLRIMKADKGDSGKYTCTVINNRGVDKFTSELKILDTDSAMIVTSKPKETTHFDSRKENIELQVGSNITALDKKSLTLVCPTTGTPKPKITWYKDGAVVAEGTRLRFGANAELILKNIQVDDAAVYTCEADNGRGKDKVSSVVNVVVPLDDLIPEPSDDDVKDLRSNLVSKKVELQIGTTGTVLSGKTVKLRCPTKGSLKPKITWYLEGEVVNSDHRHAIKHDVLVVRDQKAGVYEYTCKAESVFGAKDMSTILNVLDPVQPKVKHTSNNKLTTDENVRVDIGGKIKVKMGTQLDIRCPYTAIPVPGFSWYRNSKELTDKDNVITKGLGSILRIPYVRIKDGGTYMCAASNGIGEKATESIIVEVYKPASAAIKIDYTERIYKETRQPPSIITEGNKVGSIGQNFSILAGMKLVLKCPVEGDPKPDITWLKNGVAIAENVETLVFENANDVDDGEYVCRATNVFGTQTMTSKVNVLKQEKPKINRNQEKGTKTEVISSVAGKGFVAIAIGDDLKTLTGTEVAIRCPAIGVPKPDISFMKEGKILKNDGIFEVNKELGVLTIKKATKNTYGEYTCMAKNTAGSYNLTTNLQLLDPVPPSIIEKNSTPAYGYNILQGKGFLYSAVGTANVSAYPGTEVFIDCPVAGFPVPDIYWSRNGDRILKTDGFAEVKKNGTLLLHLTSGAQGTYECFAVNFAGAASKNLTVEVIDPSSPVIFKETGLADLSQTLKANVTIGQNIVALMGAEIIIRCPLKAEPAATIMWSGELGFELQQRDVVELDDGKSLKIPKVTKVSNGVYKCIASNVFGSDFAVTRITVAESLKPIITPVKENITTYMGANEASIVIGGNLHAPTRVMVTIKCPVSGTPSPKVSWFFNDELLNVVSLPLDSGIAVYTLNKLKLKDSGKYTCRAENVLGTDEASTYISVGLVPSIQSSTDKDSIITAIKQDSVTIPMGGKAIVSSSSEIVLQCFSRGIPMPRLSWYKDGILLDADSPYLSVIKGLLTIPSIAATEGGVFTCIARNKFGVDKASTHLSVVDPPKILGKSTNKTALEPLSKIVHASIGGSLTVLRGVKLIISCPVQGTPEPKIKWRRVDAFFNIDPRVSLTPDGDLQIQNVESADAGTYVCMAENKAGRDEKTLKLAVAEPPFAQMSSSKFKLMHRAKAPAVGVTQRIIVSSNQNITITCSVQGNPLPRIQWFKEGQAINVDRRKYFAEGDELSILNVVKEDAGNYRCIAENLAGKNMATVKVIIGDKPKIRRTKDRILRMLPSTLKAGMGQFIGVRQHSVVMIICDVMGSPKPKIMWKKNDREIDLDLLAETSRVLILKDLSFKDAGNYTCIARNEIGYDKVTTEVTVVEPANIINPSVKDVKSLGQHTHAVLRSGKGSTLHALEGEEIKISCFVEGYPLPKIHWHKNMHPLLHQSDSVYWTEKHSFIKNGEKYVGRVESMLTIKRAAIDDVEVSCKGFNHAGKSSSKLHLQIHERPVAPYSGVWVSTGADECKGKCVKAFTAIERIEIQCLSYGNAAVSLDKCNPKTRPAEKRECRTKRCGTSWGIGPWSKCSTKCGDKGLRKRTVKCMFKNGSDITKDKDCGHILPRKPRTYDACNRQPCVEDICVDNKSFCGMVKSLGYCRTEWSKEQCCWSCSQKTGIHV